MIILSHRGYWKDLEECNMRIAFERSFDMGFGTETDLRDASGKIVISHDMPHGGEITFEEVLQIMNGRNLPLALNIKADGLGPEILELLIKYKHSNYFTFDMSIPEMVFQLKHKMCVFTGLSDISPYPILLDVAAGVWLDCFNSDWYDADKIDNLTDSKKYVCIVSSELHNRTSDKQWKIIKNSKSFASNKLLLCTDYPEKAMRYFYGKD